jgi:hypothetical protein
MEDEPPKELAWKTTPPPKQKKQKMKNNLNFFWTTKKKTYKKMQDNLKKKMEDNLKKQMEDDLKKTKWKTNLKKHFNTKNRPQAHQNAYRLIHPVRDSPNLSQTHPTSCQKTSVTQISNSKPNMNMNIFIT